MNLFLMVVGVIGWYGVLTLFHGLRSAIAFTAFGITFTWFFLLFAGGTALIVKLCLSK